MVRQVTSQASICQAGDPLLIFTGALLSTDSIKMDGCRSNLTLGQYAWYPLHEKIRGSPRADNYLGLPGPPVLAKFHTGVFGGHVI